MLSPTIRRRTRAALRSAVHRWRSWCLARENAGADVLTSATRAARDTPQSPRTAAPSAPERRLVPARSHLVDEQHGLIADHVARTERYENAGAIDLLSIQVHGDLLVPNWHLLRDRVAAGRESADLGVGGSQLVGGVR